MRDTHTKRSAEIPQRIIALVGFMGAGKTTVGRALAAKMGRRFIDLDDEIVRVEGKPVAAIFADHGETYFRQAETRELKRLLASRTHSLVLSLGGGAFVSEANRAALRNAGAVVVHLSAPIDELRHRVGHGDNRPLALDTEKFRALFEQRQEAYAQADYTVDTAGKSVEDVTALLYDLLLTSAKRIAEGGSL